MDELTEPFLVISGDVLTDIDLTKIVAAHEEKDAMATIGLIRVDNPLEFGIVITREDGSIERFLEKQHAPLVSALAVGQRAYYLWKTGDLAGARDLWGRLGYREDWWLIGPFENEKRLDRWLKLGAPRCSNAAMVRWVYRRTWIDVYCS